MRAAITLVGTRLGMKAQWYIYLYIYICISLKVPISYLQLCGQLPVRGPVLWLQPLHPLPGGHPRLVLAAARYAHPLLDFFSYFLTFLSLIYLRLLFLLFLLYYLFSFFSICCSLLMSRPRVCQSGDGLPGGARWRIMRLCQRRERWYVFVMSVLLCVMNHYCCCTLVLIRSQSSEYDK
jgi:hypothetical protein